MSARLVAYERGAHDAEGMLLDFGESRRAVGNKIKFLRSMRVAVTDVQRDRILFGHRT